MSKWFYTLEEYLEEESQYSEEIKKLLETYHTIRDEMHGNLKAVLSFFPHYSEHDEDHSKHIISAIEQILGKKRIVELSPADAWAILVSAYMHDVGMIILDEELKKDWTSEKFQVFLNKCSQSNDSDIRQAANFFIGNADRNKQFKPLEWPVFAKKYVIMLSAEFYRSQHAIRSNRIANEPLKSLLHIDIYGGGKIPPRIQNVIIDITTAHGSSFEEVLKNLEKEDSVLGMKLHPRFVAVLLRIGDLCDMDNNRFNLPVFKTFGQMSVKNAAHYWKHQSIKSFLIQPDFIRVVSDIRFDDIKLQLLKIRTKEKIDTVCNHAVLETKNWFSWIENEFKNIKLHWLDIAPDTEPITPNISYEILVNGETSITSKENMRFTFSNEKAYTLIEGYNLYDDQLVFVRELIQNSLDALKIQMWRDIKAGRWNHLLSNKLKDTEVIDYSKLQPFDFLDTSIYEYYKINVSVKHHEGDNTATFIISDNGTGISKKDFENRILHTGNSWHSEINNEVNNMPDWLKPTGSFGIGLHSVFVLTDSIQIRTKVEYDEKQYNISLHSGKYDGYVFMNAEENPNEFISFCGSNSHGTQMSIKIDMQKYNEKLYIPNDEDPFKPRPESDFCTDIKEKINKLFISPMFCIHYKFYNTKTDNISDSGYIKTFYTDKEISLLFDSTKRNCLWEKSFYSEEQYDYAIYDYGLGALIWDKYNGIIFKFHFKEAGFRLCCKGILVFKANIEEIYIYRWPSLSFIDIWSGDSGNILNTNRMSLKKEQSNKLNPIIENTYHFLARLYSKMTVKIYEDNDINKFKNDLYDAVCFDIQETMNYKDIEKEFEVNINKLIDDYYKDKCNVFLKTRIILQETENILYCEKKNIYIHMKCLKNLKHSDELIKKIAECCTDIFFKDVRIKSWLYYLSNKFLLESGLKYKKNLIYALVNLFNLSFNSVFINIFGNGFVELNINIFSNAFAEAFRVMLEKLSTEVVIDERDFIDICSDFFNRSFYHLARSRSLYLRRLIPFGNKYFNTYFGYPKANEIKYNYFLHLQIIEIIYLICIAGEKLNNSFDIIKKMLERECGFDSGYRFANDDNLDSTLCKSVYEVLYYNEVSIEINDFENIGRYVIPVFNYIPCDSMSIDKYGNIILHFDKNNLKRRCIKTASTSHQQILHKYLTIYNPDLLPAFEEYKEIAIDNIDIEKFSFESCTYTKNFYIMVWLPFKQMRQSYAECLPSEKEILIEEIISGKDKNQENVPNLLRYIYRHSANKEYFHQMSYEEAMKMITDTYRRFVRDVLDILLL